MSIYTDRRARVRRPQDSRRVTLPSSSSRRVTRLVAAGIILSLLAQLGHFLWSRDIQLRQARDQFADALQVEQRTYIHAATDAIHELMDDPRSAREVAKVLGELATDRGLPTATIGRLKEDLPIEKVVPEGSTVQLLHVHIKPPILLAHLTIHAPDGQFVSGLSRVDVEVVAGDRRLKRVIVAPIEHGASDHHVAMLIDCSKSMAGAPLESARRVTAEFLQQLDVSPQVQVRSFSNEVSILTPWTTDRQVLVASLSSLAADRGTALYQAMRETMDDLSARSGRRTLVLLTDGEDSTKQISPQSLIDFARQHEIQLHIVPFRTATDNPEILAAFAAQTGGGLYPAADAQALTDAFRALRARFKEPVYRIAAIDVPHGSAPLMLYVGDLPGIRLEATAVDP